MDGVIAVVGGVGVVHAVDLAAAASLVAHCFCCLIGCFC